MSDEVQAASGAVLDPFEAGLLEQARKFDAHALDQASRVVKRMMILVIGMFFVTAISVLAAVVQAMDKREVQPYVLVKDEKTGTVSELTRVEPQEMTQGEALDKAFLAQYVRAREEYSDATAVFNFETVELMSAAQPANEYRAWLDPESNKLSPVALYPTGIVDTEITSIVRVGPGAAQVRFIKRVRGVSAAPPPTSWIAMVEYTYLTKNMTAAARIRNPMGFTVRAYSVDEAIVSGQDSASQGARR